jgi:hypothetical protein
VGVALADYPALETYLPGVQARPAVQAAVASQVAAMQAAN